MSNGNDNPKRNPQRAFTKPTQAQFYQLCNWLKANKEKIERKQMGPKEAARHAGQELKWTVSAITVRNAVKILAETEPESAPKLKTRDRFGDTESTTGAPTLGSIKTAQRRNNVAIRIIARFIRTLGEPEVAQEIIDVLNFGHVPDAIRDETTQDTESNPSPKG
jgi:hypothetical protein